jgi:uncharacterized protein (DUF1697 family)
MTKFIAFLRGINVGNIRIKMTDLQLAFEKMGFTDVKTYLQTGNVVFQSDKTLAEIKPILEKGLSETFNYEAFVLLYPHNALENIIVQYPFARLETHHAYVIFIENNAIFEELNTLSHTLSEEANSIKAGHGVLYWQVKKGDSTDTPFSKILAKAKYKSSTTVRNIQTLEKMI